jgi:fermentation-respiration switch protein FrsA (DUF1100 family)
LEILLAAAALALVFLWAGQRRMIYFPFGAVPAPSALGLTAVEQVTFTSADGLTLAGWFVRPPGGRPPLTTVIVFNGNAGNRAMRAPLAAALASHGMAVFLFDYRGYGGNPGSPAEDGLARDARGAAEYVASRPDVDPARVVYFGESLGTAVAVRLATDRRPHALILRSPFPSLVDVGRLHYPALPVRWLLRDRYECIDRIRRAGCPLLVVAGDRDGIIPAELSERLFAAAAEPKRLVIIRDADHNDGALLDGPEMISEIVRFVR